MEHVIATNMKPLRGKNSLFVCMSVHQPTIPESQYRNTRQAVLRAGKYIVWLWLRTQSESQVGIKSSAGEEKRWKESDKDNATQTYTNGFVGTQDKQKLSLEALGLQMITHAEHFGSCLQCWQSVRRVSALWPS
jgi:hypothetical protein